MEFFYDKMGLTFEGAAIASTIIISAIIGGTSLVYKGIKKFIKWRKNVSSLKKFGNLFPE